MTDLPIWECLYRIQVLNQFISQLTIYDEQKKGKRRSRGTNPISNDDMRDEIAYSRKSINLLTPKVSKYLMEAGTYPIVNYREPPAIGGRVFSNVDLMQNIFNLSNFDMPITMIVDSVQKGVGYYQDDLFGSFFRTINPFWWLWKLVVKVIRIPFGIINWAGFDSDKLETSSGGKLYKSVAGISVFIAGLVTFLASIVQILDSFGMIESVQTFFQNLGN
jgi:hypothetical protein